MGKALSLIFFFFISTICFSQNAVVVDSLTKKALPFVTFQADDSGFYSNEKGNFNLPENNRKLQISMLGYKTKTISSEKINDTLFLVAEAEVLDNVILNQDRLKTVIIKPSKSTRCFGDFFLQQKREIITILKPSETISNAYIEKIILPFSKSIGMQDDRMTRKEITAIVKINVYDVENEKPSKKKYSSNPIKITAYFKDEISVDVSDQIIVFSEKGIAVGIELFGYFDNNFKEVIRDLYVRPTLSNRENKFYESETYIYDIFRNADSLIPILEYYPKIGVSCKNPGKNLAIGFELSVPEK